MKRRNRLVPDDSPPEARQLAANRTRPLVEHYGENILALSIESLAASCYLQGVRDAFQASIRTVGTVSAHCITLKHELPKP